MDDDTLPNLRRLLLDVRRMESQAAESIVSKSRHAAAQQYAYYGVMRWRRWVPDAMRVCGRYENEVAAESIGSRRAFRAMVKLDRAQDPTAHRPFFTTAASTAAVATTPHRVSYPGASATNLTVAPNGSACSAPFIYADGMLHLMSTPLARAVFSGDETARFGGRWRARRQDPWNHEDVGLGAE
jgi:hypothetical protein